MSDLYTDLGLKRDATPQEIKAAHRAKVKKTHPDANGGSQREFEKVQNAYMVLKDPKKREYYDTHGKEKDEVQDIALQVIAQMFDSMLLQDLPVGFNYLTGIRQSLNATMTEAAGRKLMANHKIRRFERLAKRFRKKGKGVNFFVRALETKVNDNKRTIERAEEVISTAKQALAILESYTFEVEQVNAE